VTRLCASGRQCGGQSRENRVLETAKGKTCKAIRAGKIL